MKNAIKHEIPNRVNALNTRPYNCFQRFGTGSLDQFAHDALAGRCHYIGRHSSGTVELLRAAGYGTRIIHRMIGADWMGYSEVARICAAYDRRL